MSSTGDKIKKSVSYKILLLKNKEYYNIGTIVIKTYTGDILYTPSTKYIDSPDNTEKTRIEHVSWHINGQVHIKHKATTKEKYIIVQKDGERQKISEMGFQLLLQDIIKNYKNLLKYSAEVVPLDVVFNIGRYKGSVCFNFSIVSGKLIVASSKGINVPIRAINIKKESYGIDSTIRALGHHSGCSDICLQYSLRKADASKLRTERQLFIVHDMKIAKADYQT